MKIPTLYLKLAMPLLAASFAVLAEPLSCITEQQRLQQSLLQHPPIDPTVMNSVLSLQHKGMSLCRTGKGIKGVAKLNEAVIKTKSFDPPLFTTMKSAPTAMSGFSRRDQTENYTIQMVADGFFIVNPYSLSEYGQVAFTDRNSAILWTVDGTLTNLGTLGTNSNGQGDSWATAINASGQVAGGSVFYNNNADKGYRAIRWEVDGTLTNLGSLGTDSSGYGQSYATAINADGQVAGDSYFYDNYVWKNSRAFRSEADGTLTNLGSLGTDSNGNGWSFAAAINANGQVAGYSNFYDNYVYKGSRCFRSEADGSLTNLGSLGTDTDKWFCSPEAINADGHVVGHFEYYQNMVFKGYRAFISRPGHSMQAIPQLGECANSPAPYSLPYDLNDHGQVVGYSITANCQNHPFLYDIATRTLSDLNDLLPNNSGWVLENAISINEAGQILVTGYEHGQYKLALLSPVQDASPKVLYPNGGETLRVGVKATLKWHSSNTLVNPKQRVTVLFSKNSGVSWSKIFAGIKNTRSYQWKPKKNDQTSQGRIKVCLGKVSMNRPQVCDESDADFKIVKY